MAENLAGDGQLCDASPVATFGQTPFHWKFDYCTPLPSIRYDFIVPDVLGEALKKLWHFLFFCFQHLCIHIVDPWCFTVLQLLDCIFDILNCDGPKFDIHVLFSLTVVCKCRRVTEDEELLSVLSISLVLPFLQ